MLFPLPYDHQWRIETIPLMLLLSGPDLPPLSWVGKPSTKDGSQTVCLIHWCPLTLQWKFQSSSHWSFLCNGLSSSPFTSPQSFIDQGNLFWCDTLLEQLVYCSIWWFFFPLWLQEEVNATVMFEEFPLCICTEMIESHITLLYLFYQPVSLKILRNFW